MVDQKLGTDQAATGLAQPPSPNTSAASNPASPSEGVKPSTTTKGAAANSKPEEWRPREIQIPWLCWLFFTQLSVIAGMIALTVLSHRNSGFVDVPDPPKIFAGHPMLEKTLWSGGFLWTFVPTLLITLYGKLWDSVVSASADRQPYVELKKETGAPGNLTILLEYRSCNSFTVWFTAFCRGHVVLGFCLFLSLLMSLMVVPLSSYFITDAVVSKNTTVLATLTTHFNETAFNEKSDLRTVMDSVSATLLQSGSPPPWTDLEYGFQSFSPLHDPGVANITTDVLGYSGYLDCNIIAESGYSFNATKNELSVSITDRGCPMSHILDMTNAGYTYFMESWTMTDCGYNGKYSRLGLLSGIYPSDETLNSSYPSNVSFISCIPSYWVTPGSLTVIFGVGRSPIINSFLRTGTPYELPFGARSLFEWSLQMVVGFDIQSSIYTSDFGLHVLRLAIKANSTWPLQPEVLSNSTSILFTSIFAALSSTILLQQSDIPSNTTGIRTASTTRLIVILPVACILIVLVATMAALTGFLYHESLKKSILLEEPVGLLSYASILYGSVLIDWIAPFKGEEKISGEPAAVITKTRALGKAIFTMGVRDAKPEAGTVITCPLQESPKK